MASNTGFGGFNSGAQNPSGGTNSGFATSQTSGGFGTSALGAAAPKPAFGAASTTPAFGAAASTPAFGAASTASAFGAKPAFGAAASTPAFGAASTTPAFGAATSTPAFGAASSTPAFGANAAKPAFGASSTSAFGTASSGPSFGSGFGAASSTPAFGQGFGSNNAAGAGVGFGQPKVTAAPLGSNFGAGVGQNPTGAVPSVFGTTAQNNNSVGAAPGPSQATAFDVLSIQKALEKIGLIKPPDAAPSVLEQCIGIQQSLDPKSQNYLFQSYFYTLIHPSKSNNFAVPNSIPGLQDVQKDNPDSRCMVPVLSAGPDGLKERCKAQRAQVTLHRAALNKISNRLEAIAKTQSLDLKSRIDKMQLRHESLRHRIASLNRLALVLAQQGAPLCPKEQVMQRQLEDIQSKLMSVERYEELRNNILSTLHQQKKHFEEITTSIQADPSCTKDARAAINEAIENNNRALDVLKDHLAADIQLTKFLRASTTSRST